MNLAVKILDWYCCVREAFCKTRSFRIWEYVFNKFICCLSAPFYSIVILI